MKKSLKIISALTLLLFITELSISQTFSGTVLDKKTNQPLVFATVQIGDKYGVITNDEGIFKIQTQNFSETDSIKFSTMGYASKSFVLKDFSINSIFLEEKIDELEGVYLVNKNMDPVVVMQRMVDNKTKNYGIDLIHFQVFSRTGTSYTPHDFGLDLKKADFTDKEAIRVFNKDFQDYTKKIRNKTTSIYLDNFSEVYASNSELKINEQKTTQLINREENTSAENLQRKIFHFLGDNLKSQNTFKIKSGILPIESDFKFKNTEDMFAKKDTTTSKIKDDINRHLKSADLSKNNEFDFLNDLNNYTYTIENVTGYQDEMVYVISFLPKKRSAKYKGRLYITADTYAILKMEYELGKHKIAEKTNLKLLLGVKYVKNMNSGMVTYQKNGDKYFPKYIQNHTNSYTYFARPFSFRENAPRKERINIKFDLTLETNIGSRQELLIVDSRSITDGEFQKARESNKATVEVIQKYDPTLWENYNIIAPNEAIRSFEF